MDNKAVILGTINDGAVCRPLRILAVIPGSPEGSSMIFAKRQVDVIGRLGVDIGRFFLSTRTNPIGLLQEGRRLREVIASERPDVIHAHFGTMTAWLAAHAAKVPLVITFRGSDLNPIPSGNILKTWLAHWLSHGAARRARRIICVSSELRGRLRTSDGERACVIPMGYDTQLFRPMPRREARDALGWTYESPVLLFNAGREPTIKRLDLAEAAYREAVRTLPDLRLEVMRGNVPPDKVPLLMNAADALVVTSDFEGSPNVVKESMGCGLPIVSVRVGDVAERLSEVFPSRLVSRDAKEIGQAIAEIIRQGVRSNGPEVGARTLSDEAIAVSVVTVLGEAAGFRMETL